MWSGGGFETDEDKSSALLKESILKGSASGVLCALRNENLTPSVECDMPFGSLKEAYEEILRQARDGDAFCLYMAANVLFWGDYLVIEGEAEADKYADVDEYYAFAYPLAAELYENRSRRVSPRGSATIALFMNRSWAISTPTASNPISNSLPTVRTL